MDLEHPRWDEYEAAFRRLAEQAQYVKTANPSLHSAQCYLCLYGENGLTPEEEFRFLERMAAVVDAEPGGLKRLEVDTAYFQDTVLFVP